MMKTARVLRQCAVPVPSDLDIAQSIAPLPIEHVALAAGLQPQELNLYGSTRAKVKLSTLQRLREGANGKYVVVSGISPTPLGEGKNTTTIGLAQALGAHMGVRAWACLRQPSQGPTFGIKGGAAGGGYSQVIPMEDFNLHGTGDIHAIAAAHNLLAAALDARVLHERTQDDTALYRRLTDGLRSFTATQQRRLVRLGICADAAAAAACQPGDLSAADRVRFARLDVDVDTITWRRVVDVNDRMLREVTVGQGAAERNALTRRTGFDIAVASELMAILALADDVADLRRRIGDVQVAMSRGVVHGGAAQPITAEDVGCAGAMTVLMKDTVEPTLMQTLEGTPVLVHAGPFGNIAHGNSSVIADRIALKLAGSSDEDSKHDTAADGVGGVVLTEAGFGADMGAEKFFNIKCRTSGLQPDAAVLVCTVRALKYHGGLDVQDTRRSTDRAKDGGGADDAAEDARHMTALREGCSNLLRHIANVRKFGVPVLVAVNRFDDDTPAELELLRSLVLHDGNNGSCAGAYDVVVSNHWAQGGAGAVELAHALLRMLTTQRASFRLLYPSAATLREKIVRICRDVYGADDVAYLNDTADKLDELERRGCGNYAICMAKTQYSFSHDATRRGAPSGFVVPVREVRASHGARFVCPLLGDIATMPGLPTRPAFLHIDIDVDTGKVTGLS